MAMYRNILYLPLRSQIRFARYRGNAYSLKHCLFTASEAIMVNEEPRLKSLEEIPGPRSAPLLGTSYVLFLTTKSLEKRGLEVQLSDFQKYGPITKTRSPGHEGCINIYDPSEAAKIFRSELEYPRRFNWPLHNYYMETKQKRAGLRFLNDQEWHKHRSVISKRVLKPKEVEKYAPVFNGIISDLVQRFRGVRGRDGGEYEVPNLDNELFKWSFESVGHVLFDRRFGVVGDGNNPEVQDFISAVQKVRDVMFPASMFPIWFYKNIYETKAFKTFVENYDKIYSYADLFIGRKLKELEAEGKLEETNVEGAEFLHFLLSKKELTKDDLLASVTDLLFGGVDTTSNTMQWVLYMMGKNPEKQDLLYQEVTSVLHSGEHASAQSLAKMPYLKAWVRETLRLYPVLNAIPRVLSKDLVLNGYKVPAGSHISIMFYAMGRNENLFRDANVFKPERWLRECGTNENLNAFASLPFGFGTRMCVGRRLAETELYLLLSRIVQEFRVQNAGVKDVEPVMRGNTNKPERAVRVKFIDRQ